MTRERSELEFHKYDRPQQAWVCGHTQLGSPCPLGPSRLGLCQQASDCEPALENDRWICNRSQQNGGPCDTGPDCDGGCSQVRPKCVPSRSLRKRRGIFVFSCFALTLGLIFYTLFIPWRLEVLAPGGLTRNHAQILSRNTHENRCVECHEAGSLTLFELMTEGFSAKIHSQGTQSQKCLTCHDKSFDSRNALYAHAMPPQELKQLALRNRSDHGEHATRHVSHGEAAEQVACSTCHREHHGSDHDLTRITDKQCAVCHSNNFDSFSDHPEFRDWPNYQNEQIKFDHASHKFKHFAKDGKSFQCGDCHSLSATNEIIVAAGFESCKSCHNEKITTSATDGIVFFALPMIDIDTLSDEGIDVVEDWPEYAQGDFDGIIPPLMRLMLWENESLRPQLELLDDDWDFANLDPDDPEHLEAAAQIAVAIRELLATLATNTSAGNSLLRRAFGADVNASVDPFVSPFVFQSAHNRWFLNRENDVEEIDEPDDQLPSQSDDLIDEDLADDDDLLSQRKESHSAILSSENSRSIVIPAGYLESTETQTATGWFRDDDAFTVGYRPQKHADELMMQLLSLLSKSKPSDALRLDCFSQLAAPTASGQCISCHAVQRQDDETFISWAAREDTVRGFNRFSHSPHLLQPQLRDCSHCHELPDETDSLGMIGRKSDFRPINKQDCNSCHNKKAAGDNCTKCHSYHVHSFGANH